MIDETNKQDPASDPSDSGPDMEQCCAGAVTEEEIPEVTSPDSDSDVEALTKKLADTQEQLMRLAAEFENYKKRMERERSKLLKYAGENILRDLLPTMDNLDRAMEQGNVATADEGKKLQSLLEGVELTRKGLAATLERNGVEPLSAIGQPFNPDEHDALTMEASDEVPANHVLREFAGGYRFKDRVLRHAQVVVSSGPGKTA